MTVPPFLSQDADPQRDPLTGLAGMELARERLAQWATAGAEGGDGGDGPSVHALLLGLRRFEAVNLAFGESAGDAALAVVASRLTQFAGAELDGPWLAARGPGSSFLLIADQSCSRERWQLFAEQLADLVARPIAGGQGALRLSPAMALLRVLPGEGADSVLDRMGQTLSALQRQSARRLMWGDGEATPAGRTAAELEADLLKAIDRDEIEVVFQPQFALPGDALSGAEALARWNHPVLGRIGAGALFSIAERADFVVPLSRHIAALALRAAAVWPVPLRLSLNVTPADLANWSFAADLGEALRLSGFPADRLTLEVTEQVLLADVQLAARALADVAAKGVRVALDDFGAGFCNFRYLKVLPLHYLKLDRAMVEGITEEGRDLAVLRGILAMAGALDLKVIAEGIESEAQRARIEAEGAHCWQGFLRAKPMAGIEFLKLALASG